jgi:hypothetical protein
MAATKAPSHGGNGFFQKQQMAWRKAFLYGGSMVAIKNDVKWLMETNAENNEKSILQHLTNATSTT